MFPMKLLAISVTGVLSIGLAAFFNGCTQNNSNAPMSNDPNGYNNDANTAGSSLGPGEDPNLDYGSNPRRGTGMPEGN
jgi:hypothetical protein